MNSEEILGIVYRCAFLYEENLANRNIMFVYGSPDFPKFFEVTFYPGNFLHLTGVKLNDQNLKSAGFYKSILSRKLSYKSIKIDNPILVERKLSILPSLMNIHVNAKMVGLYDSSRPFLKTDILAGDVKACMGFVKDNNGYYVPNTALNENLTNITMTPQEKIIAVFRKPIKEKHYSELCSVGKGINACDINFPPALLEKINLS